MKMSKTQFIQGDCPEFALMLKEIFKKELKGKELSIIRARVKGDEYEEYGDTDWEDCHACVMIDEEHYLDVNGLNKLDKNPKSKEYIFQSEVIFIEMIKLKDIIKEEYSIYREFESLKKNILIHFAKLDFGTDKLNKSSIKSSKKRAEKYIKENKEFFKKEIKKSLSLNRDINGLSM